MQRVADLSDIPEDRLMRVDIDDTPVVLIRRGAEVLAFQGTCPHAGAPLEEGAVCNGRIVCPWHKATFCLDTGALIEPPALEALPRFGVRVSADGVWISKSAIPTMPRAQSPDERVFVIAGAGAAGSAAVAALHEADFAGRILLIGREPGTPYDRTALSKFVVAGSMKSDEVPPLLSEAMVSSVERIEADIVRIDPVARRVELADGRTLYYTAALAAPGGIAKPLDVPGAHLQGVHTLRSREDAAAIVSSVREGSRAIVIGSSFIGMEVASALREQHAEVTVVSPETIPFAKQFGPGIGAMFKSFNEANGVKFCSSAQVDRLEGEGRVEAVVLKSGQRLPCDLVVTGVGVRLATDFIHGVQKNKDGGIQVDASMQAAPGLYVAGDVAAFPLAGSPTRIEHWRVAQQQGRIAAFNMLGGDRRYDGVPFFWTYQFGKRFEYLGHAGSWDETIIDGRLEEQDFIAFLVQGGIVVGVVACQRERQTAVLAERMREKLTLQQARTLETG